MPRRRTDTGRERADAFVARNARRAQKRRLEREKVERDTRRAALIAEVPAVALDWKQHYEREMAKRRGKPLNLLRPIEEHRQRVGVPE